MRDTTDVFIFMEKNERLRWSTLSSTRKSIKCHHVIESILIINERKAVRKYGVAYF